MKVFIDTNLQIDVMVFVTSTAPQLLGTCGAVCAEIIPGMFGSYG
jgi:hypothetical protein